MTKVQKLNVKKKVTVIDLPEAPRVTPVQTGTDRPTDELFATVKHMANLGDVISIMPAIKKYYEVTKRRVQICQMIDVPGGYYQGAVHPTRSEDGTQVTMNKAMFEMIKPLVESQEYIHSFVPYSGQKIDLNFDVIRGQTEVGMPNLMIQCWIMFAFPDLDYDLSKTWVDLPAIKNNPILKQVKNKIIINFTERYRNGVIEYFFLQNYAPDLIFAGTEREHFLFCNRWNLNIPRLEIKDFLEIAYALKYSRFLMSNQSFLWNLSTALGTKRILEVCKYAPNCQPFVGENSKGFFYNVGAEYYWRLFYNKTK